MCVMYCGGQTGSMTFTVIAERLQKHTLARSALMYSKSLKPVLVLCFLIAVENYTNKDINVPFFLYYY